jgi:hypothetical protein
MFFRPIYWYKNPGHFLNIAQVEQIKPGDKSLC